MAINGDGFFSVQKSTGTVDNVPIFNGVTDYTRRGDFQVNANGNLVNGAGYYLMGVAVDPKTGNPLGNVPQVLQFQNNFIPAQATTSISYAANLPTTPTTAISSSRRAGTITAWAASIRSISSPNPTLTARHRLISDATTTGAAETLASGGAIIGGNTTLSDGAGNSLTARFAARRHHHRRWPDHHLRSQRCDGHPIRSISPTRVSTLLTKIDAMTGATAPSTVSGGDHAAHRHGERSYGLRAPQCGRHDRARLSDATVTQARTGGAPVRHGRRDRQRPTDLPERVDQRRRRHGL